MNLAKRRAAWLLVGMVLACAATGPAARGGAADTAFTYQGQLKENGAPTNGLHDFRFRLFDAASGGAQVGQTLCVDHVDVVNGLFSVQLDFGQQFATTGPRHLDIQVQRDIGQPCTDDFGYVLLSPRQQLTATPLASHAKSAFALDAADGSPANAVFVDNAGNVGIGTTTPVTKLHVAGALNIDSLGDQADALWLGIERSWVFRQQGTGSTTALKLQSVGGGGNKNFIIETAGNVGIGTAGPLDKLHVVGNVMSDGSFRAINPNDPSAEVFLGWGTDGDGNDVARIRIGGDGPGAYNGLDIQRVANVSLMRIHNNGDVDFRGAIDIGYEIVGSSTTVDAVFRVACPPGKRVIGGGCVCAGHGDVEASLPNFDGTAWECNCNEVPLSEASIVRAICVNIR